MMAAVLSPAGAGRNHLSGADAAAVRTAAVRALVITVFRPWYLAHTALADGIFLVLGSCGAVSGVVTLIRAV